MIAANLGVIQKRLADATRNTGRAVDAARLVAVSKFHPKEAVLDVLQTGHRLFGENRVQEAKGKFPELRSIYPDIELHLIGPLQTNKADDAVEIFDVIETLDRPSLAAALSKAMKKANRWVPCYIEINSGKESQKAGIDAEQLPDFLSLCRDKYGLTITGLMCIPPHGENPQPYFKQLKQLADAHHLPHISMGMSGDFETAIHEGATEVRIGTAIFGERAQHG